MMVACILALALGQEPPPEFRLLEGHGGSVMSVSFSPDGKTLASSSRDATVRLWEVATGKLTRALTKHADDVYSVIYSPDGRTLATASGDKTISLWDASSGEVRRTLTGHEDVVRAAAFSPDGKLLASCGKDLTVRLWDVETGALRQTMRGHVNIVKSVVWSPDGRMLASAGGEKGVRLWDAAKGEPAGVLEGSVRGFETIALSPDGKWLAGSSSDGPVLVWDMAERKLIQTLTGHQAEVDSVAWSPNGAVLASGSKDKTIRLWDTRTWQLKRTLAGHPGRIESLAFSPDGRTLAAGGGGGDTSIRLWSLGGVERIRYRRLAPAGAVDECAFAIERTAEGWTLESVTGAITVKARYGADDRLLAAEAHLGTKAARVAAADGKARIERPGADPQEVDVPKGVIVTSAPDWTDTLLICRRYDRAAGGKQEFPGLWIHPEKPAQRLTFTAEKAGGLTLKREGQPLELIRLDIRLRDGGRYAAWSDAEGRMIKLVSWPFKEGGTHLVREGFEAWAALVPLE
jgi:WD40 repeat protein